MSEERTRASSDRFLASMTAKYAAVLVVFALAAFLASLILRHELRVQHHDAEAVYWNGEERLLITRAALIAARLAQRPGADVRLRAALASTVSRLVRVHAALASGRLLAHPRANSTAAIESAPALHLAARERRFVAAARALIGRRVIRHNDPALVTLERMSLTTLPAALKVITARLRRQGARHLARITTTVRAAFIATLALLLAAAMAVFRPMARRVRRDIANVQAAGMLNQTIVNTAADAIITIDTGGAMRLFNPAAERAFGLTSAEAVGRNVTTLMPEPERTAHTRGLARYLDAGGSRVLGQLREIRARRKDGTVFPAELSVSEMVIGSERLFLGMIRDISQRKEAEALIARAQARYRELVNNLGVGVYRNRPEPDGRFLEINPAMLTLFEAASQDALMNTRTSALYQDPEERAALSAEIARAGFVRNREIRVVTLKGRPFWAAITARAVRDEDGLLAFDGVIEDITDRKAANEAISILNRDLEQRLVEIDAVNQELEAFSYSVSHDLRAPLRSIDGFSQALLEDYGETLDAQGRDFLRRVRAATQRMGQLIDDLLKLSRVTRAELHRVPCDLGVLAEPIAAGLRAREPERTVTFAIASGLTVNGDPQLLAIALTNLLDNAWKFTSREAHARIELNRLSQDGETVYFVRDNGAGFDPAYTDKLFRAFQRLHALTDFPGVGIGLATVQRIVRRHGGRVWAEGAVGQGATFFFTLGA